MSCDDGRAGRDVWWGRGLPLGIELVPLYEWRVARLMERLPLSAERDGLGRELDPPRIEREAVPAERGGPSV